MAIGVIELLILAGVGVAGLVGIAVLFFVIRAATGESETNKPK